MKFGRAASNCRTLKGRKLDLAIKFAFFDISFSNFNASVIPMRFCSSWFCAC